MGLAGRHPKDLFQVSFIQMIRNPKPISRSPLLIMVCSAGLAFTAFIVAALIAKLVCGGSEEAFFGAALYGMGFAAAILTLGSAYALSVARDIHRDNQEQRALPAGKEKVIRGDEPN